MIARPALTLLVLTACGPESAPWTRPIPEEVPTIVHRSVPGEERRGTVRLVRELVVGDGGEGDFNYLFGSRAPQVAVDPLGRMFVADPGNRRVQLFDERGTYLRTLGRAGEGPGEFAFPLAAVVAGPHLFISDTQRSRLSRWTHAGELEWDRAINVFPGYFVAPALGLSDGSWLMRFRIPDTETEVAAHMSPEGEKWKELAPVEVPGRTAYERHMIWVGATAPRYAADSAGNVYVSPLEEYQVFSYRLDGSMRWALQVAADRPRLAEEEKTWAMEWFRRYYPNVRPSEIDWPGRAYALADLKVDGRGRVYAFPYLPRGMAHDRLPVDVYSPDGERILAGWLEGDIEGIYWLGSWKPGPMLGTVWQTARGDRIYGVVEDREMGVNRVVRHRLEFGEEDPAPPASRR